MITKEIEKKIFSLLDLTSLKDSDDAASIAALCQKAQSSLGQVAAVCIYPQFVPDAVSLLSQTSIKIATVANFPHGEDDLNTIQTSIQQSIADGATEIDVVFPYKLYLQGHKIRALEVIEACKNIVGKDIILKVILETGVIHNLSMIEELCHELIAIGPDFLKTSTGKVSIGATIEAAAAMLSVIKATGGKVGFKAAGGIRSMEEAMQYLQLAEDVMGVEWLTPEHFRIGTSGF